MNKIIFSLVLIASFISIAHAQKDSLAGTNWSDLSNISKSGVNWTSNELKNEGINWTSREHL